MSFTVGTRVVVEKPFEGTRTPCPQKGTVGTVDEIEKTNTNYPIIVRFDYPFTCSRGFTWLGNGEPNACYLIHMTENELVLIKE